MNANRIILLVVVAAITFAIVLFISKPSLLEEVWMWMVGLAGAIAKGFQLMVDFFKRIVGKEDKDGQQEVTNETGQATGSAQTPVPTVRDDDYEGITVKVFRFSDDGQTTVGLLYTDDGFYCYTLEDTYREAKVASETRIPAGTYELRLNPDLTALTKKYREKFPEWFDRHIQLQNVPDYQGVYIHNGGSHKDTAGCILVSDSLSASDSNTFLTNSRETFKRLYLYITDLLKQEVPVRMVIHDERTLTQLNPN